VITIPTADLVGVLADVIPFANPDDDIPVLHCVRIEWDEQQLHALATDRYRAAISTWDPTDDPDEDAQDSLFTEWGGGDNRWALILPLPDAKELVKVFKLGAKQGHIPLVLDFDPQQLRLKVARNRDTGHSAITTVMNTVLEEFPKLAEMLTEPALPTPIGRVDFSAKYLADFAKVRPRGPLKMAFAGEGKLVHLAIGERFRGAIQPTRSAE
jgi:hypothetical protein